MKKILINTYYFFPENTPRAFRSTELTKALVEDGYYVILALPSKYEQYKLDIIKKVNVKKIVFCGNKKESSLYNYKKNIKNNYLKKKLTKVIRYFLSDKNIYYSLINYRRLSCETENFDCLISIGLPFSIHLGSYLYAKNLKIKLIGDYGDPFSLNPAINLAFYFKYIEKKILTRFDYITIPTESSFKYYKDIIDTNKIKIIPQGFNIKDIHLSNYKKNNVCTFAYAGIFYEKIRNPKELFRKLSQIDKNFKFIIYTDLNNSETIKCLSFVPDNIKNKIIINGIIEREKCIYELSKCDFLINIANKDSGQLASKIIDYSLSKRPILNIKDEYDLEKIDMFLDGKYDSKLNIELKNYDIKLVVKKFEQIIEEDKE